MGEVPGNTLIWRGILWHAMRFVPGTGIVVHVLPRLAPESPRRYARAPRVSNLKRSTGPFHRVLPRKVVDPAFPPFELALGLGDGDCKLAVAFSILDWRAMGSSIWVSLVLTGGFGMDDTTGVVRMRRQKML